MQRKDLAEKGVLINVSTNTTVSPPSRGLLINGASSTAAINVTLAGDSGTLLLTLATGVIHPIEVKAISNVNTTATGGHYFY